MRAQAKRSRQQRENHRNLQVVSGGMVEFITRLYLFRGGLLPGKQVAVNFHQLYSQNQPQLPKKWYTMFSR